MPKTQFVQISTLEINELDETGIISIQIDEAGLV